eukprot:351272-Chlamydomonas_euryale.AAC.3
MPLPVPEAMAFSLYPSPLPAAARCAAAALCPQSRSPCLQPRRVPRPLPTAWQRCRRPRGLNLSPGCANGTT